VAQNFFGQVRGNSGKIIRTPKSLPAPTPTCKMLVSTQGRELLYFFSLMSDDYD